MRDFLRRMFTFGVLFTLVSWGASRCFDHTVVADTLVGRTDREFESTASGFRRMVYGDSHPKRAVDPEGIGETFNFATEGESYVETYYRLRWTLERPEVASELRLAVLPLDLHSLSSFRTHRFAYPGYTSRYVDFPEVGRRSGRLPRYLAKRVQASFVSFFGRGDDIWEWLSRRVLGQGGFRGLERGWLRSAGDLSRVRDRGALAERRARYHFGGANPVDPLALSYFEDSLKLLKEKGRRVLLVRYPVTREYAEAARPWFTKAGVEPVTGARYADGESVFWFDGLDLWPDRPELFGDSDHANAEGARLFTRELHAVISRIDER